MYPIILGPSSLQQRRQRRLDLLVNLLSGRGPKPNCAKSPDCKTISVIIELDTPGGKIGHTGIGIGNEYYDYGPINGAGLLCGYPGFQWWDRPGNDFPGRDPADIDLPDIEDMIHNNPKRFDFDILEVQWCMCKDNADKVEQYWKDLYKNIADGNSENGPIYSIPGLQCTSSVCQSINRGRLLGSLSPETYLKQVVKKTNECGENKGKKAFVKLLRHQSPK